jgi:hypothetical protein
MPRVCSFYSIFSTGKYAETYILQNYSIISSFFTAFRTAKSVSKALFDFKMGGDTVNIQKGY